MNPIRFNNNDKLPRGALREYKPKKPLSVNEDLEEKILIDDPHYPNTGQLISKSEYESQFRQKLKGTLPMNEDNSWPTKDVLTKLIWATKYLLNEKSYDGHGYEQLEICVKRGEDILRRLNHEPNVSNRMDDTMGDNIK